MKDALLKRLWFPDDTTIGEFYFDGVYRVYMLEDMERADGLKIPGQTCIPAGLKLKIGRVYSPKFKRIVPIIYTEIIGAGDTPDDYIIRDNFGIVWKCVEIHPGNRNIDSDGCQLPGLTKDIEMEEVYGSRRACVVVYKLIFDALDAGEEINYTIVDGLPEDAHDYKP